jgi:aspartate aminotransferase-like enzyme/predicted N-acetyltransferase YhbS
VASQSVRFRVAAEPADFEQIFQLAYETFVEEIPQHPPNPDHRHVDRFHAENTYLIAVDSGTVVGMIAVRDQRPFSLDEKLGSVDPYLPPDRRVCELRLLAVRRSHRHGIVFRGLIDLLLRTGRERGYDLAIISGTLRQAKLYRHLGFEPFGPLVGTSAAPFQPMFITIEQFETTVPAIADVPEPMSFLPGPVVPAPEVRAAFERAPVSHRDRQFADELHRTASRLARLTNAPHVQVLVGSGTLANDVVAAQLSLDPGPGLVVTNGEFGERLADHARRMHLPHEALVFEWGEPFDGARLEPAIVRSGARWLWAVASETSTGMLNDVALLKRLKRRYGISLCLDCVSAIGAVPVDLDGVLLASGASGKALGAYPGLSMVFYAGNVRPEPARLPRYLDLGFYAQKDGVPFTHSSNLVAALDAALARFDDPSPYRRLEEISSWFRCRLRSLGIPVLVDGPEASPAVVTIPVPRSLPTRLVGDALRNQGLLVAYQSEYLVHRNWLQVSWMGQCSEAGLERLLAALERRLGAELFAADAS